MSEYRIVYYPIDMGLHFYCVEEKKWFGWSEVGGTETRADTRDEARAKLEAYKRKTQVVERWTE